MDQHPAGSPAPSVIPPTPVDQVQALDTIDDALGRLAGMTIAEHVGVFTDIHQQLTSALAVTGNQPGPASPPAHGDLRAGQQRHGQQRPGQSGPQPGGSPRPGQPFGSRGR